MEKLKVAGLMTLLTLLLVAVGGALLGEGGAILFFVVSLAMNFGMYWFSDRIVLRQYRAHEIGPDEQGEFRELYEMVDRLRQRAGLPMPKVAVAEQAQPNAFATGRNYDNALVCVTRGMWQMVQRGQMSPEQLEGVMAHELAHVRHRHMLVGTIAASMAGAVMLVARWGIFFGGRNQRGGNPIVMLALIILAPIAAMLVKAAVSRRNEFEADAEGAEISGKPLALAGALQRMDQIARGNPMDVSPSAAHLAIVNPLAGAGGITGLFRTHPPTEDRVARLQQLAAREDVDRLTR